MIPKNAKALIDEIMAIGYAPRGKEAKFFESVKAYIESDRMLTAPMAQWLQDIYAKAAGGGRQQRQYF